MTLLFFDGFETYDSTASITDGLGDVYGSSISGVTIVSSTRITDGQAMRVTDSTLVDNGAGKAIGPQKALAGLGSTDTWIFGVAVKVTGLSTASKVRAIFELLDSDTDHIVSLRLNGSGDLSVVRYFGSTVITLDTAAAVLTDTNWHYIEWKVKINNPSGTWVVNLDEVEIMNGSGNTDQAGEQRPSHLRFGHISTESIDYDDLYIADTTGSFNNDFLGDIRVQRLRPNGATATEDFTRNTGSTNWEQINAILEDDDTTYVESRTVAERDLYEYEDIPVLTDVIYGVIAKPVLRKSDAGSRTYKLLCSSGPAESDTGTLYPPGSYARQAKVFETDPNTGALWQEGAVNVAKFGVEIVS